MGTSDILLEVKGNPEMDWHPVQGGVAILLGMLHGKETGISSGHLGLRLISALLPFFEVCDNQKTLLSAYR